jgi:hypothetical protein
MSTFPLVSGDISLVYTASSNANAPFVQSSRPLIRDGTLRAPYGHAWKRSSGPCSKNCFAAASTRPDLRLGMRFTHCKMTSAFLAYSLLHDKVLCIGYYKYELRSKSCGTPASPGRNGWMPGSGVTGSKGDSGAPGCRLLREYRIAESTPII